MKQLNADLFPFILLIVLTLAAFIIFWSVMDMVIIGASLAVVLMPLHHRISRHTLPEISAGIVTFLIFFMVCIMALFTFSILTSNVAILTKLFGTVGIWLDNPAANPLSFGIPVTRATLTGLLNEGMSLFVEYQDTLLSNLTLIAFKLFVFLTSLFYLLRWGEEIFRTFLCHVPAVLSGYVTRLSEVTVDTLYAIYIVQVAIAALTFVISIPVFYLLGYGDVLFFSFLAAFCELIPVLGSSVVFILIGTYALASGDTRGLLIMFFFGYLIVSCVPEFYVRPVLVGRRVKIHPVIMFIGIFGGMLTLGLAGFVLGPVIVVLLITSYRMYVQEKKECSRPGVGSQQQ
jgi:predicted PurR-regulated permease PerM